MKKIINKLRLHHKELYDLPQWRDWFSNAISLLFVFLLPVTYIYLFPDYASRGLFYLIAIDTLFWIYLLLRVFIPGIFFHFRNIIWLIMVYILTISFFLHLGPGYARPAWLILCAVLAAIFYGVSGALISSFLNSVVLVALFFLSNSTNDAWLQIYKNGLKKWLMFAGNMGFLSFCASVSVGFLINRINRSLYIERNMKEELQSTNEELAATNEELEAINEEFEAQNKELLDSASALRKSEEELKEIFNSSHDAFIIHDINGIILDVNNRMLSMYGLNREKALSLGIADISSPEADIAQLEKKCYRILNGETMMFEWKAQRPEDNYCFDVEVGLRKLNWRGKDTILASIRDLSDRKNAEAEHQRIQAQLVQAQKMEAVGTLAGGIAHDFNNILGGIMGSLSLLDILLRKENLNKHHEIDNYLQIAYESSKRAAEITKQLLVLSRKREIQKIPVSISNSINNVMNICKSSFPKLVELDFHPIDPSLQVFADPTQIEQVLLNLCMNASHAMTIMRSADKPQGGQLTVEAQQLTANHEFYALHSGSVPSLNYVQIRIKDTGIGMDEECRKRIFEPFFSTKSQDEGTGLGLAITYAIVTQHKGFIDVYSEPGKGSVFIVYLPLMEKSSAHAIDKQQEITMGSGHILVVDDEESMLVIASGMLELCGYTVTTTNSALRGIELFKEAQAKFDAVILDNSMPDMSGLDAYLILRGIYPGVRVILSSGFMDNELIIKCRKLGIKDFIDKPYRVEELALKISNLLK